MAKIIPLKATASGDMISVDGKKYEIITVHKYLGKYRVIVRNSKGAENYFTLPSLNSKVKLVGVKRRNPTDLEIRERFDRCVASVTSRGGVRDPEAVCAASIRRTAPRQLAKISGEGRSLAAARRHARGLVLSHGRLVRRPASRIRKTKLQRRHGVRRVMQQQALAKRRAMRNPGGKFSRFNIIEIRKAMYGGKHGFAVVGYKNGITALIFASSRKNALVIRDRLKHGVKYHPMILKGVVLGE